MVDIFEPKDALLKKYISTIYFHEAGDKQSKYITYPSPHTAAGLFRNTVLEYKDDTFVIDLSHMSGHFGVVNKLNVAGIQHGDTIIAVYRKKDLNDYNWFW